ncbi:MAG: methyl-accepting chemotaxis protein [Oceanospirillaceae bacterium]
MKSIRAKIFALVLVPLILVVCVLTAISINGLKAVSEKEVILFNKELIDIKKEELKSFTDIAKKSIAHLSPDIADDLNQMRDIIRALTFGENGYFFIFDQKATTIVHAGKPSLEGKNLATLKDTRGTFIINDLIKIAQQGGGYVEYYWENPAIKQEALKLSYASMLDDWNYMIGIGIYLDDIDKKVSGMKLELDKQVSAILMQSIIASIILFIICAIAVLIVAPMITKPLIFVATSLEQIAEGDRDLTQRIAVTTKDEAGRVAIAFNQFVAMVQGLILEIRESTDSLNNSMAELEILRNRNTQRLLVQVDHRDKVVEGINELLHSASDISQNSIEATKQANTAAQEAEQGIKGLNDNNAQITQLAEDIQGSVSVIAELETEVSSISTVLSVIQDIAEQTNLLALNAAIEAARAGDQGRGFAVVADEVRALAARTRKSTEEIHDMIQRLESKSQTAVKVMDDSQVRSVSTADNALIVINHLSQLSAVINDISEMNAKIESTSDLQSRMTAQMNDNIALISQLGAESVDDAQASAVLSEDVASQTNNLYKLVNKFRI